MQIEVTQLFEDQLKAILEELLAIDIKLAKDFKLYLETIIINMPTKAKKYKKSIYFDDENIKDIDFQNYTIVFRVDGQNYKVLGIFKKIS